MCDLSLAVRYIYAWTYECGGSKYEQIVQAFCHIHSADVLVTTNKMLLLLAF